MNNPTEISKENTKEEIGDEHTELNEDELEQVNGGVSTLKTRSETVLDEVTLNFSKIQVNYDEY